jgi:hypothetical protein
MLCLSGLLPQTSLAQSPVAKDAVPVPSFNVAADTVDVEHVINAYHTAVTTHDGARLASLFLPQGGMWLNVLSDEAFAIAKSRNPAALKVRVGNYADFAKQVSTTNATFNPTHTHLRQNSDSTIASVYFDFVLLADGKKTNRGCW